MIYNPHDIDFFVLHCYGVKIHDSAYILDVNYSHFFINVHAPCMRSNEFNENFIN